MPQPSWSFVTCVPNEQTISNEQSKLQEMGKQPDKIRSVRLSVGTQTDKVSIPGVNKGTQTDSLSITGMGQTAIAMLKAKAIEISFVAGSFCTWVALHHWSSS